MTYHAVTVTYFVELTVVMYSKSLLKIQIDCKLKIPV